MQKRKIGRRLFAMLATAVLAPVAAISTPTAAQAATSGGGCTGAWPISSCISMAGTQARADFYLNDTWGGTRCYAQIMVAATNIGNHWSPVYTLNRRGVYGPTFKNVTTIPATRNGEAVNMVHVWDCNWNLTGIYRSPTVYYRW